MSNSNEHFDFTDFFRIYLFDYRTRSDLSLLQIVQDLQGQDPSVNAALLSRIEQGKAGVSASLVQAFKKVYHSEIADEVSDDDRQLLQDALFQVSRRLLYGAEKVPDGVFSPLLKSRHLLNSRARFVYQILMFFLDYPSMDLTEFKEESRSLSRMLLVHSSCKSRHIPRDLEALVYYSMAQFWLASGVDEKAMHYLHMARDLCENKLIPDFSLMIRYSMLRCTSQWINQVEAIHLCARLDEEFNEICALNRCVDTKILMMVYLVRHFRFHEAACLAERLLDFCTTYGFKQRTAVLRLNQVWMESARGNYEKALSIMDDMNEGSYEYSRSLVYRPLALFKTGRMQEAWDLLCDTRMSTLFEEDRIFLNVLKLYIDMDDAFLFSARKAMDYASKHGLSEMSRWILDLMVEWLNEHHQENEALQLMSAVFSPDRESA